MSRKVPVPSVAEIQRHCAESGRELPRPLAQAVYIWSGEAALNGSLTGPDPTRHAAYRDMPEAVYRLADLLAVATEADRQVREDPLAQAHDAIRGILDAWPRDLFNVPQEAVDNFVAAMDHAQKVVDDAQ